ncbi:MAG: DnaD domain protein, partial [Eubacteriales bacterium]|nr:DnaD domain protein [Eubacteriales bacterium]
MSFHFALGALPFETTPVDNLFITEYMPRATGDQVRVYLYGLLLCRYPALMDGLGGSDAGKNEIAAALGMEPEAVEAAFLYWQNEGLLRVLSTDPFEVDYLSLRVRAGEPALTPGKYHELVQAVQALFAPRTLTASELRKLYDWIEIFGMSEGTVLELCAHCIGQDGERQNRRVSMKYMDTVARDWADAGVLTVEAAKARVAAWKEKTGGAQAVLKRWRMRRNATEDELELYEKWTTGWGFTAGAVQAACAVLPQADRPTFKYLDGVLDRLRNANCIAEEEIKKRLEEEDEGAQLSRLVFERMGVNRGAKLSERLQILGFHKDTGFSLEMLLLAAEQARDKKEPYGYFRRVIADWDRESIRTVRAAKKHLKEHAEQYQQSYDKTAGKQNPAL